LNKENKSNAYDPEIVFSIFNQLNPIGNAENGVQIKAKLFETIE